MPRVVIKSIPSFSKGTSYSALDRAVDKAQLQAQLSSENPKTLRGAAADIMTAIPYADTEANAWNAKTVAAGLIKQANRMDSYGSGGLDPSKEIANAKTYAQKVGIQDPRGYLEANSDYLLRQINNYTRQWEFSEASGDSDEKRSEEILAINKLQDERDTQQDMLDSFNTVDEEGNPVGGFDIYYKMSVDNRVLEMDIIPQGSTKPAQFTGSYGRVGEESSFKIGGGNVYTNIRGDGARINLGGVVFEQNSAMDVGGNKIFAFRSLNSEKIADFDSTKLRGKGVNGAQPGDIFHTNSSDKDVYYRTKNNTWVALPMAVASKLGLSEQDSALIDDFDAENIDKQVDRTVVKTLINNGIGGFDETVKNPESMDYTPASLSNLSYVLSGKQGPVMPFNTTEQNIATTAPGIKEKIISTGRSKMAGLEQFKDEVGDQDLRSVPKTNRQTAQPEKFNLFNPTTWF